MTHSLRKPATLLLSSSMLLLLGACANMPSWRISPTFQIQNSPDAALAAGYQAMARQLEAEGRPVQAMNAWQQAVNANPQDPEMRQRLAISQAANHQYERAVANFRKVMEQRPGDVRAMNNLGYAHELLGQTEAARDLYAKALQIDPNHDKVRANHARLGGVIAPVAVAAPAATAAPLPQPAPPAAAAAVVAVAPPALQVQSKPNVTSITVWQSGPAPVPTQGTTGVADLAAPRKLMSITTVTAAPPPANAPAVATAPTTSLAQLSAASGVVIEIYNGNGVKGSAAALRGWAQDHGVKVQRIGDARPFNVRTTQIFYRRGHAAKARQLAKMLPVGSTVILATSEQPLTADIRVVMGKDLGKSFHQCTNKPVCATPVAAG